MPDKDLRSPVLRTRLPRLTAAAARDLKVAATRRTEVSKLLAGKDFRKLVETDAELNAGAARVTEALSEDDKAAAAWQKALAEAVKEWDAMLAELAELHPDSR